MILKINLDSEVIMSRLKEIILILKHQYKANSKLYTSYLRKKGIRIGENTFFYSPWTITVDILRPWMVEIGNNVHITAGCTILQHGKESIVIQEKYGDVIGTSDKVKIGDNVFIGVKSTILKGVEIGDNVIIGANTLVNKDCPSNGVYAGNPVKFIMSLDQYREKRINEQIEEAKINVVEYYKQYKKFPDIKLMKDYFWIFTNREEALQEDFEVINLKCSSSKDKFNNTQSIYNNYEEFLNNIKIESKLD